MSSAQSNAKHKLTLAVFQRVREKIGKCLLERIPIYSYVDYALTSLTVVDDTILVKPTLRIEATSSNVVVLTWPTNSIGFIPQHSPDLNSVGWTSVTNSIHLVGTNEQVLVPVNSSAEFFRLSNPWVR